MPVDPIKLNEVKYRGFTIVPSVLTVKEVRNLIDELEILTVQDNRVIEEIESKAGKPHPDKNMVLNIAIRGQHNAKLLENDMMHEYLDALMTNTCILYASQSSSMPPKGANYSTRIHVDCARMIPGYITNLGVLIALSNFTKENGATYFLPGSHLSPDLVDEETFYRCAVRGECQAGDMIVFNTRTWHKGGENKSDKPRHSVALNICRSYMRQRFDYPRMIEKTGSKVLEYVGERGKRLLGYNVRMPTCHEEYYLPPEQRLYKANQG
jgi:ectoine hydroxylase-related dioxygenase (phytanoyl-CoA dioxygenase family)